MSYRIIYEGKDRTAAKQTGGRAAAWCMALILLAAAAAYSFAPGGKQAVQEFFWPGGSKRVSAAAENMVFELRSGLSLGEAMECFCREILDGNH